MSAFFELITFWGSKFFVNIDKYNPHLTCSVAKWSLATKRRWYVLIYRSQKLLQSVRLMAFQLSLLEGSGHQILVPSWIFLFTFSRWEYQQFQIFVNYFASYSSDWYQTYIFDWQRQRLYKSSSGIWEISGYACWRFPRVISQFDLQEFVSTKKYDFIIIFK